MARKLSKIEKDDIADRMIAIVSASNNPTTSMQLSKEIGCTPEVAESVSLSYNIPNVLHGPEAALYNKRVAANIGYKVKLEKLRPQFEELYNKGMNMLDIQKEMKLSDIVFPKLCNYLGHPYLNHKSDAHSRKMLDIADKRKQVWVARLNEAVIRLKQKGVPITAKQIAIEDSPDYSLDYHVVEKYVDYLC